MTNGKNGRSDEWYTPKWIIEALKKTGCVFDLDPCAPRVMPYRIARKSYNKDDDGLAQTWEGNVWCNPPYSRPHVTHFVTKLSEHGRGVALLFNRMDSTLWHDIIFPTADAMLIMKGRVKFIDCDLKEQSGATCGSILVAWGQENANYLKQSGINGKFIEL